MNIQANDGSKYDPSLNDRIVNRRNAEGRWEICSMLSLAPGDVFCLFDLDERRKLVPVLDEQNRRIWKVRSGPVITRGVAGVEIEEDYVDEPPNYEELSVMAGLLLDLLREPGGSIQEFAIIEVCNDHVIQTGLKHGVVLTYFAVEHRVGWAEARRLGFEEPEGDGL